ncbi:MAG TPA: hypothetical protein VHH10_13075 [Rubrobacteraceae bacterium]|jgi:hypothetical protein|nr:hypothetical protein [Rubrobacteraceae bacterium]
MNHRVWYAADALMADLAVRHHHVRAASEEQLEKRMRRCYPGAVAILVRREESWRQVLSRPGHTP